MEISVVDYMISIFKNLKIPQHTNEEANIIYITINEENLSLTFGVWHRESTNTIILYSPIAGGLTLEEVKDLSFELLLLNDDLLFGNYSIANSVENDRYIISYQLNLSFKRDEVYLVTEKEIEEFIRFAKICVPIALNKINKKNGLKENV